MLDQRISTPRWAMARALEAVDKELAGIDLYLADAYRLSANDLRQLRLRLVTQ